MRVKLLSKIKTFQSTDALNIMRRKKVKSTDEGSVAEDKNRMKTPRPLCIALDVLLIAAIIVCAVWFISKINEEDPRINVSLTIGDVTTEHFVFESTVGEFLRERGIVLETGDELSASRATMLDENMEIVITRAFPVAVKSGNGVSVIHLTSGTVGDALRLADVDYDVFDELSYLSYADLVPGMQIVHTDVMIDYKTSYKTLNYLEETVKDDKMYDTDKPVVVQQGENGEKQVTQRIIYKDGVEVSREVVDQVVIVPAVDEITKVGTKIRYQTKLSGEFRRYKEPPVAGKNGWVSMTMDYITAYTGDTRTSTGVRPTLGTIAVSTKYIPYGTEIYVPGYGYGKAQDTGAFRNYTNSDGSYVNQLDVFMNTEKECRKWGRKRNVTVLVRMG